MRGGTGRDNPYYQGYAARSCGLPITSNPFTIEWARNLWDAGWKFRTEKEPNE